MKEIEKDLVRKVLKCKPAMKFYDAKKTVFEPYDYVQIFLLDLIDFET